MHLINGHCSFMKNTHSITSGIEKPRQFVLYRFAGDGTETLINRNGIQQDRLSLLDQIGLFFILLSRCHCGTTLQLKFSYRSTIQLSTISAALLQLVRSEAVTFPSPLLCLCFRSVGNHIQCTPPFIFGGDLLFCVQTIHARTETADIYLSSSCLERPHKASPWGGVLNKYLLWPTMSEFKMPSWQKEPWCVLKSEKQKLSIQISMFLHFPKPQARLCISHLILTGFYTTHQLSLN